MHEIEAGVWKRILIHLLRILQLLKNLVRFNKRYGKRPVGGSHHLRLRRFRKVPTFGRDTIRRFSNNVSDLKQMAARMYEDILQVTSVAAVVLECADIGLVHYSRHQGPSAASPQ